ncbi:pentatricopeptide repeat-containing protein At2g03880, mitochondrial-like [Typha latifolia]|uniref:pentatricopeptide repeat-containing protein At2g03880, mitochondrial-like n=1 Tax=Typha latifolia TaxID=4733 RepID=UPI003C2E04FF
MVVALRWKRNCHLSSLLMARCLLRFISTSTLPSQWNPVLDISTYNARIQELARLGHVEEARELFNGMSRRSVVTWNSMIFGYCQNSMVEEARSLFDSFAGKNIRTWTILISGYAKCGRLGDARFLFNSMPERNPVSWNAMISGYVQNGDINMARRLFDEMPEKNIASWNSMITGYCHNHQMREAQILFYQMPEQNLVSWTVMISGYVQIDEHREAWGVFCKMHHNGVRPDQANFAAAVSAVMGIGNLKVLESLRSLAFKTDFEGDVVVGTAILNVYTRDSNGLDTAMRFFEGMRERNEYSWSTMIAALSHVGRLDDAFSLYERDPEKSIACQTALLTGFAQNCRIHEARLLFEQIPNPNAVSWNAMITGYAQNNMLDEAKDLFNRTPFRNSISWAAMISGYAQNGKSKEALDLMQELHRSGMLPSLSSFTSSVFACANIEALEVGRQLHSLAIKAGSQFNTYVNNSLITMYAKCKTMEDVAQVFSRMRARDTVSWNSVIAAFSQNYMLEDARITFDKMPIRDVVSWTSIISAYVQAEHGHEAMQLFVKMLGEGVLPNSPTITSILSTCGSLGATKLGQQIHTFAVKLGQDLHLFVGNALITMYFKCGCVESLWVFDQMEERDIVTWNSVIAGCAQHGFGREAIEIFELMKSEGNLPNQVTFVGLLCACSHAGLVDEGWYYFKSMTRDYGLMPVEGHYACLVDLLGRAGHLYEAEAFIENMPIEPDSVVWGALLGACRIHQNAEVGRRAAERLFDMEPQNSGNYVLLSNIFSSLGMWDEVEEVRKLMRERGVTKEPGCSWMQIKNKMHSFVTGDKQHEQMEEIYAILKELYSRLRATGYVPDTNYVLHDVDEEQKENALLHHSEKLAVAYGLLATPNGTPIQVMKNLRICGDCHTFIKFVSQATDRDIDIRDGNRFHHFRDGICSCGDYW